MTHASLFSGIGGFDLAAQWAGWENVFNCEIDKFCKKVLKYHYPNTKQYDDIRSTDFTEWRGKVDVLSGGFPCQPFSQAGLRLGTSDDRYLWPAMLYSIKSIRPRWVVAENVLGIITWSKGLVFEHVCADLEDAGYAVQPFIIPACGVGAPHRRDRVWFVATDRSDSRSEDLQEREIVSDAVADDAHADGEQCKECNSYPIRFKSEGIGSENTLGAWDHWPNQPPICSRNDGLSYGLDGITFPKWANESIKAYGNAIVPQVAYQIFKTINQFEKL